MTDNQKPVDFTSLIAVTVRKEVLYSANVRSDAWKVVVVVFDELLDRVDAETFASLFRVIDEARASGIQIVAVGVGVHDMSRLYRIGQKSSTTFVGESDQLNSIVETTAELACYAAIPITQHPGNS